jgi:hypothetical protein
MSANVASIVSFLLGIAVGSGGTVVLGDITPIQILFTAIGLAIVILVAGFILLAYTGIKQGGPF